MGLGLIPRVVPVTGSLRHPRSFVIVLRWMGGAQPTEGFGAVARSVADALGESRAIRGGRAAKGVVVERDGENLALAQITALAMPSMIASGQQTHPRRSGTVSTRDS